MSEGDQRRIRALLEVSKVDYIHNDLANTAFYFKKRISKRVENNDRDGLFLEMLAGLTMTAFAMEANVNFIGFKIVEGWKEYQPFEAKLTQVLKQLGIQPDFAARPFSTLQSLKSLRNILAHGKPKQPTTQEEAVGTYDELQARLDVRSEWEKLVTPDFVSVAYDDVNQIWQEMLEAAKISVVETLSGSTRGMTFIEYMDEKDEATRLT